MAAPEPDLPASPVPTLSAPPWWQTERARMAAYAFVLVAVGGWSCFHNLNRGMLIDDESAFGITTDLMRETGDYVIPYLGDGIPHLNAAPLYNWLCCLTAEWFGDTPLRYRGWSAVFAVLCALAVLLLGAELFRPEVGLLAGLLMLTNRSFLFEHAARNGVMEPGTALFLVLMAYCYARSSRPGASPTLWWGAVGGCLGLAVMMKPPAMGGFFFGLIGLHHLFARRDLTLTARFTRPLLALAVAALIASPWYAAVYQRMGYKGLRCLFYDNSVGRMIPIPGYEYAPPPYWVYLEFIWYSSWAATLFWPALLIGAVCSVLGWQRSGWWLPTLLAGAYTVTISASTVKNPHYVYCAFPFLCLLTAALLLVGLLPRPAALGNGRLAVRGWKLLAVAGVVAAFLFVRADVRQTRRIFRYRPGWEYPPMEVYRGAEPEVSAGRGHFVLYRYPGLCETPDSRMGFGSIDRFYLPRLEWCERARTAGDLGRVLADGKPAVVVLPPKLALADVARLWFLTRPDRVARVRTERMYYLVLTFHGAEEQFGLTDYLRFNVVPWGEPDRF